MSLRNAAIAGLAITAGAASAEEKRYDFQGFDKVKVQSGVTVNVDIGPDFSVRAKAHRGKLNRLEIDQSGDVLDIDRSASWGLFGRGKRDRFEIWITVPQVSSLEARSGSTLRGNDLGATQDLIATSGATLHVSGAFETIRILSGSGANLSVEGGFDEVEARASGGASLNLKGTCTAIEAQSQSGASLNARALTCAEADGESTGGASLSLKATDGALLKSHSGASLVVYGNPRIDRQETSGGASIKIK